MGYVCVIIGILFVFNSHPFIGIIIGIIGLYIIGNKKDEPTNGLHCTVQNTSEDLSSLLNSLEQIAYNVTRRCKGRDVRFLVMVHKTDINNCSISFTIEDISFEVYHITFGPEFRIEDNRFAYYEATIATGFSFATPEAMKNELLLQFHWPGILINVTDLHVYNQKGYLNNPLIVLRFVAKYTG